MYKGEFGHEHGKWGGPVEGALKVSLDWVYFLGPLAFPPFWPCLLSCGGPVSQAPLTA
jgi:hypothetical protein